MSFPKGSPKVSFLVIVYQNTASILNKNTQNRYIRNELSICYTEPQSVLINKNNSFLLLV